MEYNEENLKKALKKHPGISTGTIKAWKHRGKIPDFYKVKGVEKRHPVTDKEFDIYSMGLELLSMRFWNESELAKRAGVKVYTFRDAVRTNKSTYMDYNDLVAMLSVVRSYLDLFNPFIGEALLNMAPDDVGWKLDSLLSVGIFKLKALLAMPEERKALSRMNDRNRQRTSKYEKWQTDIIVNRISEVIRLSDQVMKLLKK